MERVIGTAIAVGSLLGVGQDAFAVEAAHEPAEAPQPKAGAGAPNVIWILLDDVGFGASSAFGGLVETPNLDALAAQGLRYTNFHTTAISSPTRAAILTGRNHHSVGMGLFPETAVDLPGYNARIPAAKGTVAELLRENGYSTFAVGKWHLTPVEEATPAGPFNRWPTGKGFDRYYGFLYGETDQWHPQLIEDTNRIAEDNNGRHLNELLTDRAISYVSNTKSLHPEKPFFLYLAPGATHAPHQVAASWIEKYRGKFDGGWDKYREDAFARQKKLGIVPASAVLPARNPNIKEWNELSKDEQRLFARYFEAYAGFLSYTDAEIGRLLNHLKRIGQFDNTIIAVVIGDNGASKEGTEVGTTNGLGALFANNRVAEQLKNIDKIGSEFTSPNYPLGWAQAANVPFRYWKQDANSEGGTRNPLILSYPKGIKDKGGIRNQYGHVIDLLPTTLELGNLPFPKTIGGVRQESLEGTSLAYTVDAPQAASRHNVQYYEINGTRAIYSDGWKAATLHKPGIPFEQDVWELYYLNDDPTETRDLAKDNPGKLKELQALFEAEGRKYHVFPLKDTLFKDFASNHSAFKGRGTVELYPGVEQLFSLSAPSVNSRPFDLTAQVDIPEKGAQGVLFANGGRFGGSSLYLQNGKLHYAQTDGSRVTVVSSNKSIAAGKSVLGLHFEPLSATAARVVLSANGASIGEGTVPLSNGIAYFSYDEGFDVGRDLQTPVTEQYKVPFAFSGQLDKVRIEYRK